MAVKLASLRSDAQRENEGDWVEIPDWIDPETGDMPAVKVRGINFGPYQTELSIVKGRWVRKYGGEDQVPVNIKLRDVGILYAKHLLLDWRGFDEAYSPETARAILADPEFFLIQGQVILAASKISRIDAEFVEDAAKNSSRSSVGNSKTAALPPTG